VLRLIFSFVFFAGFRVLDPVFQSEEEVDMATGPDDKPQESGSCSLSLSLTSDRGLFPFGSTGCLFGRRPSWCSRGFSSRARRFRRVGLVGARRNLIAAELIVSCANWVGFSLEIRDELNRFLGSGVWVLLLLSSSGA